MREIDSEKINVIYFTLVYVYQELECFYHRFVTCWNDCWFCFVNGFLSEIFCPLKHTYPLKF